MVSLHGSEEDCDRVISEMEALHLKPSLYSFNTLLNRYAISADSQAAQAVLQQLVASGLAPDSTTYNTLIKLYVRAQDAASASKVLMAMEKKGFPATDQTRSLLLGLSCRRAASSGVAPSLQPEDLLEPNAQLEQDLSPFVFAKAIQACNANADKYLAMQLLDRAVELNKADDAVFVAAAKVSYAHSYESLSYNQDVGAGAEEGEEVTAVFRTEGGSKYTPATFIEKESNPVHHFESAIAVMDRMVAINISMTSYSLSYVLNLAFAAYRSGHMSHALDAVLRYLDLCSRQHPELFTGAVCQKVLKELIPVGQAPLAAALHVEIFHRHYGSSFVVDNLFQDCGI